MWRATEHIKVLLAVEETVANKINQILREDEQLDVIGLARPELGPMELLRSGLNPDVILLETSLPDPSGYVQISELKAFRPNLSVLLFSDIADEKTIKEAFLQGTSGYLLKDTQRDEFIYGLKKVGSGGRYLSAKLSVEIINKMSKSPLNQFVSSNSGLSQREIEVLRLVAEGLTNLEMSEKLFLSKRTIEGHRSSLIEKTGTRNTASLIRYAILNGIVQ